LNKKHQKKYKWDKNKNKKNKKDLNKNKLTPQKMIESTKSTEFTSKLDKLNQLNKNSNIKSWNKNIKPKLMVHKDSNKNCKN